MADSDSDSDSDTGPPDPARDPGAAAERALLEGGAVQQVGADVVLGRAGFADDGRPDGALVAVPDAHGGYALGDTVAAAAAGKVQGRSTSLAPVHPVGVPDGGWSLTLATAWVEPPGTSSPTPRGVHRGASPPR